MANDYCTTDGAKRLKAKIEQYWSERGYNVELDLVDAGFVAAMRSARTDVRSNMKNGMPRRKVQGDARDVRTSYVPD
ncbi:MAG: phosphoglycolate phosphatase [Pseudomonadota bacterium]